MMTAAGLTSVTDANVRLEAMEAYQDAYHSGEMRFRVYMMISGGSRAYKGLRSAGIYTGFGDENLRIGGVKFFVDGSASERTMRMSTPFIGRPNDYGILVMQQDELEEVVEEAHRAGFQIGIHANGDVAIDMVLKAYKRVQNTWPLEDFRHRIEHCSLVNTELLKRIKAAGAIPTPFYTYVHYHGNKWLHYGEEKMRWMFAHGSFLEHGIPVASASDYIPGPFEPLMAIQSMVTRKDYKGRVWGPNQRISVDQALQVCTVNAARASFEEQIKGSLSAGKLADFVVLAEDPHNVDPDRIKEIEVVRTVVGGKTVYPKSV
jgi:predicted amidohydrolase YtcJ